MARTASGLVVAVLAAALTAGCATPARPTAAPRPAPASPAPASPVPSPTVETAGTPDLSRGIDKARFAEPSYQEHLSDVTSKLGTVSREISKALAGNPDLVTTGVMPGEGRLVLYWSGPTTSPALRKALAIARHRGIPTLVAPRKVSRGALSRAEATVGRNMARYRTQGIQISSYGGFAADFDGFKISIDTKSTNQDLTAIQHLIEADTHIPVQATLGGIVF